MSTESPTTSQNGSDSDVMQQATVQALAELTAGTTLLKTGRGVSHICTASYTITTEDINTVCLAYHVYMCCLYAR